MVDRGMGQRRHLAIIPLPLIPLPVPGRPKKMTAGKNGGNEISVFYIFAPHLFAMALSMALVVAPRAGPLALFHGYFPVCPNSLMFRSEGFENQGEFPGLLRKAAGGIVVLLRAAAAGIAVAGPK